MPSGSPSRRPQGRSSGSKPRSSRSAAARSPRRGADGGGGGSSAQRKRLTSRAVILLAVTGLLLVSYASSLHAWWQQRTEIAAKEAQIAALEGELDDIETEFSRWRDDAFLEQQARERFGWVMPGEVGYRVIGADGAPVGLVGEVIETEDVVLPDWHEAMWGSITEAGLEPEDNEESADEGPAPDVILDIEGEQ